MMHGTMKIKESIAVSLPYYSQNWGITIISS